MRMQLAGRELTARPRLVDELKSAHRFGALVQPHVGLIDAVRVLPLRLGEPDVEVVGASLGDLSKIIPHLAGTEIRGGAGSDTDFEAAWTRAVVEAAERYAALVYSERDFVVASARTLGPAALDLDAIPRCSERELADPRCPLRSPDPRRAIRWVRGYSLLDRVERLVPAVMAHLGIEPWEGERFWVPISTGVAAHVELEAALVNAICEGIERDALALTWLGRLPLPLLEAPEPRTPVGEAVLGGARTFAVAFADFDATTDLGIPTVLSVQRWDGHPHCRISVSCATAQDSHAALRKARCEAAAGRLVLDSPQQIPDDVADFCDVGHGAQFYGRGHRAEAFDFLLGGDGRRPLAPLARGVALSASATSAERLAHLLGRLRACGMDAIAIDLTTDELRDVGLWAVRVVVPQLMPISFVHRARFLATPRLSSFVARRTGVPFTETDVNSAPLPFA